MKYFLCTVLLCLSGILSAQEPHKNPDHVKGNSATIYEALPFYNEACEYYAKGDTNRAKLALLEAINTSFALTEAHLFLAEIYREIDITDSAFYFFNSGIDFAIEQEPHFYFHLFETGMLHGQYDYLKHNLKHFHKLYGNEGLNAPYEENFQYDRDDYEFYLNCISMVYDYKSWENFFQIAEKFDAAKINSAQYHQNKMLQVKNGKVWLKLKKKNSWKKKALKNLPKNIDYASLSSDKKHLIFTLKENRISQIYLGHLTGKKVVSVKKLSDTINDGNQSITPFLYGSQLYFSSNRNGTYDLFVSHIDLNEGTSSSLTSLDRINSAGDDIAPFLDPVTQIFYFSSNGHVTFGGFDIFECTDFEIRNGTHFPINPRNPGASFNSYHDEVQISQNDEAFLLFRELRKGGQQLQLLKPQEKEEQIYFEITPKEITP